MKFKSTKAQPSKLLTKFHSKWIWSWSWTKLKLNKTEAEQNWSWTKLKPKLNKAEAEAEQSWSWSWTKLKLKLNKAEAEQSWSWNWTKLNWVLTKLKLKLVCTCCGPWFVILKEETDNTAILEAVQLDMLLCMSVQRGKLGMRSWYKPVQPGGTIKQGYQWRCGCGGDMDTHLN